MLARKIEDTQPATGTQDMLLRGVPADVAAAVTAAVTLYNCAQPKGQRVAQGRLLTWIIRRWIEEGCPLPPQGSI